MMTRFLPAAALLIASAATAQPRFEANFAKQTLDALQRISIAEKREYCGYIGYNQNDELVATDAVAGDLTSCLADEPPEDLDIFASYHTHANYDPEQDSEVPSYDDVLGDQEEGIDGYVSTPGGRLWFVDGERAMASQVCGVGCLTADPRFVRETDPDWTIPPTITLQELYDRQ